MLEFRMEGLEELRRKLRDMGRRASAIDGDQEIPLGELLSPEFMRKHTDFGDADEMVKASGFTVETPEDFASIPDDQWDAFIRSRTEFSSWNEMLGAALEDWTTRQLGLK